jgi:hypothetical protein
MAATADVRTPWLPPSLQGTATPDKLRDDYRYVVLEEIVDGTAVFLSWPWPLVDVFGRLFWSAKDEAAVVEVATKVSLLRSQLYEPSDLERDPRCGDTFAVPRRGGRRSASRPVTDLRSVFEGSVFDISADAHVVAKLAYQSGVAAVRSEPGLAAEPSAEAAPLRAVELRVDAPPQKVPRRTRSHR